MLTQLRTHTEPAPERNSGPRDRIHHSTAQYRDLLKRGPSQQSHVLENRDTYGHAQVCSGSHEGSSVDRRCQLSFRCKFWHLQSPLPQGNRLLLDVSVHYRAG